MYQVSKGTRLPQKPRQGPLRPQTGAGKHRNKKRDDLNGVTKHKERLWKM
jgi:hypothetical protein